MPLTKRVSWAYGLGSFMRVGENLIGFYLLFYLTTVVGIPAGVAGLLSGAAVLIGALLSPVIGILSDRSRSRFGRRRPFMIVAAIPAMVLLAVLFTPVDLGEQTSIYYAIVATGYIIAYYAFLVPYDALGASLTDDSGTRATIRAICTGALYLSVFVGGTLVLQLQTAFSSSMSSTTAWSVAVIVSCSVPGIVFALIAWRATRGYESPDEAPAGRPQTLGSTVRLFTLRPVLAIFAWALLYFLANAVIAGTIIYSGVYVLGLDESTSSLLFLVSAVVTFIAVAPAAMLARRIGKKSTLLVGMAVFVAVGMVVLVVGFPTGFVTGAVLSAAFGVTNSIALVCAYAMIYDLREVTELRLGQDLTAVVVGLFTLIIGVTSAIGPALIGGLLESFRFDPSAVPSSEVAALIVAFQTWLPATLIALAALALLFWNVDEREHNRVVERLKRASDQTSTSDTL